jgi:hypothetical protein
MNNVRGQRQVLVREYEEVVPYNDLFTGTIIIPHSPCVMALLFHHRFLDGRMEGREWALS